MTVGMCMVNGNQDICVTYILHPSSQGQASLDPRETSQKGHWTYGSWERTSHFIWNMCILLAPERFSPAYRSWAGVQSGRSPPSFAVVSCGPAQQCAPGNPPPRAPISILQAWRLVWLCVGSPLRPPNASGGTASRCCVTQYRQCKRRHNSDAVGVSGPSIAGPPWTLNGRTP